MHEERILKKVRAVKGENFARQVKLVGFFKYLDFWSPCSHQKPWGFQESAHLDERSFANNKD